MSEKRVRKRRDFSYYMQLTDTKTRTFIGHLADISTNGFKLDSDKPIPIGKEYHFHLALTSDVAKKSFILFSARSKWCQADAIDPFVFNVGFQILKINPEDYVIFKRIFELYGTKKSKGLTSPRGSR